MAPVLFSPREDRAVSDEELSEGELVFHPCSYCAPFKEQKEQLKAENERLRAALRTIRASAVVVAYTGKPHSRIVGEIYEMANAALSTPQETEP